MISKNISTISKEPFIREFTFAIIKSIESKKLYEEEKFNIDSDLVPRVSERVVKASMGHRTITPMKNMQKLVEPLPKRRMLPQRKPLMIPGPSRTFQGSNLVQQTSNLQANQSILNSLEFSKVSPLLHDPSVFSVECPGPNRELFVVRTGQKQITRIILSKEEINKILERISNEVKIPLLEGIFKVVVEDFYVSAIVSEMVGSKFIIKKQIPELMNSR